MALDRVQSWCAVACRDPEDDLAQGLHRAFAAAYGRRAARPVGDFQAVWSLRKAIHSCQLLCFAASYKITAVAIAEFKDSTVILCGIRKTVSQYDVSSSLSPLPAGTLERLNDNFKTLTGGKGKISEIQPLPEEASEPDLLSLPRIAFPFNRRNDYYLGMVFLNLAREHYKQTKNWKDQKVVGIMSNAATFLSLVEQCFLNG